VFDFVCDYNVAVPIF